MHVMEAAIAPDEFVDEEVPAVKHPSLVRRLCRWLDAWSLRGYCQDTHVWAAKAETIYRMRATISR